ncbi:MBL fold metallo-hydrolase [Pararhizobium sp. IMCC21322]|uniref:MBL fold metallo-hydrolase n=1 Tax=Pararhizobium sp. IMCC21322 TaxID=3067903 RepID=UPI002741C3CC|nr:MBL fold metallo-hydrolase [Pararhizobium sp. IMCC21322]
MFAYRVFLAFFISSALFTLPSYASPRLQLVQSERAPVSTCLAIAQNLDRMPTVTRANYTNLDQPLGHGPLIRNANSEIDTDIDRDLTLFEARITFFDHSTYIIESSQGVTAATDYFGYAQYKGQNLIPTIVTMNKAHSSHYTANPDSRIAYALPGWGDTEPAKHLIQVEDMLVRNVTTDIVRGGFREADANSIFIFEVAGLCIGHLGHLHHALTDSHFANIGRLDVVMVPIDGAMTQSLVGMAEIVKRLRSSVVLPMHARGFATPATLIAMLGDSFDNIRLPGNTIILSVNNLPQRPTVIVPARL